MPVKDTWYNRKEVLKFLERGQYGEKYHKIFIYCIRFYFLWPWDSRNRIAHHPNYAPVTTSIILFVKGSEKFDRWFKGTSIYKKHLEGFVKRREMTLKQKLTILLTADAMIAIPFIILDNIWLKLFLVAVVIYKYYYFITKIKTVAPEDYALHQQAFFEKTGHK